MSKKAHFMFNLTAYPEVKVLMKVTRNVALSPVEEYIKTNPQVKSQIEWEFQRFLGSLAIPLYNKMRNYNYHDTLNAFVKQLFEYQHRNDFEDRQIRIEEAEHLNQVELLPFYERIKRQSEEYWDLDIMDQELLLECDDPSFQKVIDRMYDKSKYGTIILKLNEVHKMRIKTGQKYKNMMDLNYQGKLVLDSAHLIGARRIEKFMLERKER